MCPQRVFALIRRAIKSGLQPQSNLTRTPMSFRIPSCARKIPHVARAHPADVNERATASTALLPKKHAASPKSEAGCAEQNSLFLMDDMLHSLLPLCMLKDLSGALVGELSGCRWAR